MTTKKPTTTLEEKAFEAFKKEYQLLIENRNKHELNEYEMRWTCFRNGYLAAAKNEKPEISNEKIRKVIEELGIIVDEPPYEKYVLKLVAETTYRERTAGKLSKLITKLRKILKTPEKEKRRPRTK